MRAALKESLDDLLANNRRAKVVSFSGIDGAGKSTQIAVLCDGLKRVGVRVRLLTFWDDVARFARVRALSSHSLFKGDKGNGAPGKPILRKDKNIRRWYLTGARLLIYLCDVVWLRIVVARELAGDADVVIFDRYLYDELVHLSLNHPLLRAYVRLLIQFAPKPDLAYLLDADPVKARERKPEYPIEFLHENRAAYLLLRNLAPEITVIEPMEQMEVEQRVEREAWKKLL